MLLTKNKLTYNDNYIDKTVEGYIMTNLHKDLSTIIKERHSIRQYDPSFKLSKEELKSILEEATLAPSSSNMQAWSFIVVQDDERKKDLALYGNNAKVAENASAVIAVLGDTEMYQNVDKIYDMMFEAGYVDEENKQRLAQDVKRIYPSAPLETRRNMASFDAGLASMQLMLIAKNRGLDTITMGGFDKAAFAKNFNVDERYMPIVLIAIGKAAGDHYFKTVRLPVEDIATFI